MAINREFDSIVTVEPPPDGAAPVYPEALSAAIAEPQAIPQTAFPTFIEPVASAPEIMVAPVAPRQARRRPRWVVPSAIAAVGLIASGTLGYFLYTTNSELNSTRHRLAVTQQTLETTQHQLADAKLDLATRQQIERYVYLVTADAGKVNVDYNQVELCDSYSTCRFAAQAALTDMQSLQTDRHSLVVPVDLANADSQLGDSLSAGIAALQELISGMDTDNVSKIRDGFKKLEGAMLTMSKAEVVLGSELRQQA
ncbi:MAG: hypothetical protein E6I34_01110 [Chloroflexi bacterium]|nr:MAG: hypothetical protein E6I34_01110 [Chloroflexota bacterium]